MIGGPSFKGSRSLLGRSRFQVAGSTTPSTMESRYSSTVIPLACAWARSPASMSGLKFRVTVTIFLSSKFTPASPSSKVACVYD